MTIKEDLSIGFKNSNTPITIGKGGGAARQMVEPILSGPANKLGTEFLTNMGYTAILDRRGTTTDVANLTNGKVHIKEDRARIGGWPPRVKAADISTLGFGGDSLFNGNGKMHVGLKSQNGIK